MATNITKSQQEFLDRHGISKAEVFDATGLTPDVYLYRMVTEGCSIAVGCDSCPIEEHTLQSVKGHCVQCHPEVLLNRWDFEKSGDVFLALSAYRQLVYVGSTQSAGFRIKEMRQYGYGGTYDWELVHTARCDNAALIEHYVFCKLFNQVTQETTLQNSKNTILHSLFSCSVGTAISVINSVRQDYKNEKLVNFDEIGVFPSPEVVKEVSESRPRTPARKRTVNDAFMKAQTPSAALAAIVGATPSPRTEVVSKLWAYIKKNKLQDAVNKRMINADARLQKIFGKPQVSMFEMAGLIGKHLK